MIYFDQTTIGSFYSTKKPFLISKKILKYLIRIGTMIKIGDLNSKKNSINRANNIHLIEIGSYDQMKYVFNRLKYILIWKNDLRGSFKMFYPSARRR